MKAPVVIDTQINAQGEYEGVSFEEYDVTANDSVAGLQSDDEERLASEQHLKYRIDINDLNGSPPPWVLQANQLFQQSIAANTEGVYCDYMRQVQAQFDHMHQLLQQQMQVYTNAEFKK